MSDDDNDIEILAPPALQLKFAGDDAGGVVEGFAARFGELDAVNDRIEPGAFTKSIAAIQASGHRLPMLWAHRQGEPIGSWRTLQERAEGLYVRGQINSQVERGREALALVKAGDLSGLSIGFLTPEDGRVRNHDGSYTLRELQLLEISLVSIPAASRARVTLRNFSDLTQFADFLRASGVSRREAELVARKSWPALTGETPDLTPLLERAERARIELRAMKGLFK